MLPKVVVAVILAAALAVPAGITLGTGGLRFMRSGVQGASAPLPQWKAGDTWTYNLTGFSNAPGAHVRFRGNLTITVEGTEPKARTGLAEDAYNLTLSGSLSGRSLAEVEVEEEHGVLVAVGRPARFTNLTATISGRAFVGTEDLALLLEQVSIAGGMSRGGLTVAFALDVMNTYTPGLALLAFPLEVGKRWDQDVQVKSVGSVSVKITGAIGTFTDTKTWDLSFALNRTAQVTAFGNATVPAGTFPAFQVVSHRPDRGEHREGKEDDEAGEDEAMEVEASALGAEHMASGMGPGPDGQAPGLLRFAPANLLWYSGDVENLVAFKLHFPSPLGKAKVSAALASFHLA